MCTIAHAQRRSNDVLADNEDDPDTFGYDRVDHIDTFKWLSASCRNLRETMDMYKGVYYHEGLMKLLENIENQSQVGFIHSCLHLF
jgi:hypothetical protein